MSLLSRPALAGAVARILQGLVGLAARGTARSGNTRLPEYPGSTEEIDVPTSVGPARVVVYRPESTDAAPPVHINLHGGGYVISIVTSDDPICRALAAQSGAVVLNVGYVVAPQHPFPEPPNQVYEVVTWVAAHGSEHGWDGSRLTVGGQSSGGALAAAAARLALENSAPKIALQVLHYAPLDLTVPAGSKPSAIAKPVLRPWMGEVFDSSYVPDPAQRADRLVSPAAPTDTADLTGIAPAVIISAEYDILATEQQRYADRLDDVGALVEYRVVPGVDHGYDRTDDPNVHEVYAAIAEHIRRATRA